MGGQGGGGWGGGEEAQDLTQMHNPLIMKCRGCYFGKACIEQL